MRMAGLIQKKVAKFAKIKLTPSKITPHSVMGGKRTIEKLLCHIYSLLTFCLLCDNDKLQKEVHACTWTSISSQDLHVHKMYMYNLYMYMYAGP